MIENNMKKISVIIPMKNESENVQIIIENLLLVLSKISLDYDI
jgi:glycosyltransferase involved in cell wall biosynthesis